MCVDLQITVGSKTLKFVNFQDSKTVLSNRIYCDDENVLYLLFNTVPSKPYVVFEHLSWG